MWVASPFMSLSIFVVTTAISKSWKYATLPFMMKKATSVSCRRMTVAFFHAAEACATVTTIQVCATAMDSYSPSHIHFSQREQHQLQRIATRNVELGRFVASPSTYPTEQLLTLLGQFKQFTSCVFVRQTHRQDAPEKTKARRHGHDRGRAAA